MTKDILTVVANRPPAVETGSETLDKKITSLIRSPKRRARILSEDEISNLPSQSWFVSGGRQIVFGRRDDGTPIIFTL
jgi:hypothetical protein